ncbi:MAG: hypothetical protein ABSB22_14110 [Thermodesulfobacteriota bacterium]
MAEQLFQVGMVELEGAEVWQVMEELEGVEVEEYAGERAASGVVWFRG